MDANNIDTQISHTQDIVETDTNKNNELYKQQQEVKEILLQEKTRLNNSLQSQMENLSSQQRIMLLNKNSSERISQYNYILLICIIIVLGLLILTIIKKYIDIPVWIIIVLRILIVSIGIILCYIIVVRIKSRDPLNYQKLNLVKPITDPKAKIKQQETAEKQGNLLEYRQLTCKGQNCCGEGTIWDSIKHICQPSETFTNIKPHIPNYKYYNLS